MAPFDLIGSLGKPGAYLIYLAIGIAFGVALEVAGFANSRKLANQFYLKDMTVLKVMFTAIVTAMVLVFLAAALGLLDYNSVYVPATYLVPGIVGGLIMGVGFILGGYCPGTSLVAVASLKIDGFFFFFGILAGVFLFGETVGLFSEFWYSTFMGRFTLPAWLGAPTGVVVFLIVLMALAAFWAAEQAEAHFGGAKTKSQRPVFKLAGAGALALGALVVMGMGQPTPAKKWEWMAKDKEHLLTERQVQIEPGELISLASNNNIRLILLDVRDETDYNLYHLVDSRRVPLADIRRGAITPELLGQPPNAAIVLVSNDETRSTEAWKLLTAEGVLNVYLLEGGINHWLDIFAEQPGCDGCHRIEGDLPDDALRYTFAVALGSNRPEADPETYKELEMPFTPKVKLQVRKTLQGGCG